MIKICIIESDLVWWNQIIIIHGKICVVCGEFLALNAFKFDTKSEIDFYFYFGNLRNLR